MRTFEFDRRNKSDGDRRLSPASRRAARGPSSLPVQRHEGLYESPGGLAAVVRHGDEDSPPRAWGFPPSSPQRYPVASQQQQQHIDRQFRAADRSVRGASSAPVGFYDEPGARVGRSRASVGSTPSPLRSGTRTFTGKRRASGEMASSNAADADEPDDGLELGRSSGGSSFDGLERTNFQSRDYDPGWDAQYYARRSTDEHFPAPMSRQYDLQRRNEAVDGVFWLGEEEKKRQGGGRWLRSGDSDASTTWHRISGLRISPAAPTDTWNAPRTVNETRQHVMPEMWPSRRQVMSGAAPEPTGAPLSAAASATSGSATILADTPTSAEQIVRSASASIPVPGSAPGSASASPRVLAVRPIANASRNIKFGMLQPHFERPLQEAALHFGVCTTLLKKICRKNGISNWPFRKICGLRKSIASMEKQVQYFDGEQKKAYAEQLRKLQVELEAYKRIGMAPTPEFERMLEEEEEEEPEASGDPEDDATGHNQVGDEDKERVGSDVEEQEDDDLPNTLAGREQRVSPMQEHRGLESFDTKQSLPSSGSRRVISQSAHYTQETSGQTLHQDERSADSGGRYEDHFHQDRVHSRPATVVDRELAHEHHAYHSHPQQRQHFQYQQEHFFLREHLQPHEEQHFHLDRQYQQRARPHPQGMSTIDIHQRALPSIGALLRRQDRDPGVRPDIHDHHRGFYDQREGFQ